MKFFYSYYYNSIVTYDLINKFQYKNIKQLPKLKKIVLCFSFKKIDINFLTSALLSFQLITSKKGQLIKAKKFNTVLKIKRGNPVGCKIILTRNSLHFFLFKLLLQITNINQIPVNINQLITNTLAFKLKNLMLFNEIAQNYKFFKDLTGVNIFIVTNTKNINEFLFLLKALKIPIYLKKSKFNSIW